MTAHSGNSRGWFVHDVVVGVLAGAAAGFVIGLFAMARIADHWMVPALTLTTSALAAVALLRWERNRRVGLGAITITVWVVLGLSVATLALIITALANFT